MGLKNWLISNFPGIGKYKRYWVALFDHLKKEQNSYSQYAEDKLIWQELCKYDLTDAVYVDVGANHPTDISNTYLLYRKGLHGFIIEPNEELISLFKKFRTRDRPLMIGCSNKAAVLPFHISRTPVISSFSGERPGNFYKTVYVPVMTLDQALSKFDIKRISLLSIDVEGLNLEVLQGATETIQKSILICLEYDHDKEIAQFEKILGPGFEKIHTVHCNLIYRNKNFQLK